MKKSTIAIIVLSIVSVISLFFNGNGYRYSRIKEKEVEDLTFQRDSIVKYGFDQSVAKERLRKEETDSIIAYNSYYRQADSINKIKLSNEIKRLKKLTRADRDRLRDSISIANGIIPNRTR